MASSRSPVIQIFTLLDESQRLGGLHPARLLCQTGGLSQRSVFGLLARRIQRQQSLVTVRRLAKSSQRFIAESGIEQRRWSPRTIGKLDDQLLVALGSVGKLVAIKQRIGLAKQRRCVISGEVFLARFAALCRR
jgi:hypothetical protein